MYTKTKETSMGAYTFSQHCILLTFQFKHLRCELHFPGWARGITSCSPRCVGLSLCCWLLLFSNSSKYSTQFLHRHTSWSSLMLHLFRSWSLCHFCLDQHSSFKWIFLCQWARWHSDTCRAPGSKLGSGGGRQARLPLYDPRSGKKMQLKSQQCSEVWSESGWSWLDTFVHQFLSGALSDSGSDFNASSWKVCCLCSWPGVSKLLYGTLVLICCPADTSGDAVLFLAHNLNKSRIIMCEDIYK